MSVLSNRNLPEWKGGIEKGGMRFQSPSVRNEYWKLRCFFDPPPFSFWRETDGTTMLHRTSRL